MPMPQMPLQAPPQSSFLGAAQQQGGGMPPPMRPPMPPQAMQNGQPPQQGLPPQMMAMLKQVAGMGRNGDTLLAHLTPGEKTVPPEVQTPKVLATLDKAYKDKGVTSEQFTAGSPQSSINPATSLPEYNFMSSFLPIALGIAGSLLLPGVGTALGASAGGAAAGAGAGAAAGGLGGMLGGMSPLALSSIGGGLGTTAGGLLSGQDPMQAGLSGLMGGLGGYGMGSLMGGAGGAAAGAAGSAPSGMSPAGQQLASGLPRIPGLSPSLTNSIGPTAENAASLGGGNPEWTKLGGLLTGGFNPYQVAGGVGGSALGNYLGKPDKPSAPHRPSGFDDKMRPVSELPPWNQQLGQTTYNGPVPSFSGFDPMTNYPASWRFM